MLFLVRRFDAVIHFAGRKAVGESVQFPMLYYTHNVAGAVNLIEAMRKHNVKNVRSPLAALHTPATAQCMATWRRRSRYTERYTINNLLFNVIMVSDGHRWCSRARARCTATQRRCPSMRTTR